jgi:hypothetical protein
MSMGIFAETGIVDYCLSFADQEKQNSVFRFPFLFAANKWKFAAFPYLCLSSPPRVCHLFALT